MPIAAAKAITSRRGADSEEPEEMYLESQTHREEYIDDCWCGDVFIRGKEQKYRYVHISARQTRLLHGAALNLRNMKR